MDSHDAAAVELWHSATDKARTDLDYVRNSSNTFPFEDCDLDFLSNINTYVSNLEAAGIWAMLSRTYFDTHTLLGDYVQVRCIGCCTLSPAGRSLGINISLYPTPTLLPPVCRLSKSDCRNARRQ